VTGSLPRLKAGTKLELVSVVVRVRVRFADEVQQRPVPGIRRTYRSSTRRLVRRGRPWNLFRRRHRVQRCHDTGRRPSDLKICRRGILRDPLN